VIDYFLEEEDDDDIDIDEYNSRVLSIVGDDYEIDYDDKT
jgi:hypothetical protein